MQTDNSLRVVALYLSVIQFFFFTTWIVYVVYLGDMLESIGIGRDKLLWFILLDQIVFVLSDTLMGFNADRVERMIGRLGPTIIGFNAISCLAFVLLPLVAATGDNLLWQILWSTLLVIWLATSSALRAPPIVLLMKHAAKPQVPSLAALTLIGLALGGAVSPYLGLMLKQLSPLIPFLLTGATLFLTTIGLIRLERLTKRQAAPAKQAEPIPQQYFVPILWSLLGASLLLGFGFQIHIFLNSKAQFLQFTDEAMLVWLLPIFWIGFKLLVFPGSALARRLGAIDIMLLALPLGVLGLSLVAKSPDLIRLIGSQLLTGGIWGILFMAGITTSISLGRGGNEGKVLGLWFSMLAVGAVVRVVLVLNDLNQKAETQLLIDWIPAVCWVIAGILLFITWSYFQRYEQDNAQNKLTEH